MYRVRFRSHAFFFTYDFWKFVLLVVAASGNSDLSCLELHWHPSKHMIWKLKRQVSWKEVTILNDSICLLEYPTFRVFGVFIMCHMMCEGAQLILHSKATITMYLKFVSDIWLTLWGLTLWSVHDLLKSHCFFDAQACAGKVSEPDCQHFSQFGSFVLWIITSQITIPMCLAWHWFWKQ